MGGSDRKWIWAAQGNDIEYLRGFATTSVLDLQTEQWMCLYMNPQSRYSINEAHHNPLHTLGLIFMGIISDIDGQTKIVFVNYTTFAKHP